MAGQVVQADGTRIIEKDKVFKWKSFFLKWEWMLLIMLVVVNIANISASPNYANTNNIMNAMRDFLDKAIVVFPMALVILLGEIDISVASTMALSSVIMGMAYQAGVPMGVAIVIALLVGTACGFVNGIILVKFPELSSMIVTLATQIIFRGIASILLQTNSVGGFPDWYNNLGWGKVGVIPIILIFTAIEAVFFIYLVHFTKFGRRTYAMGNSVVVSKFSGIKTNHVKLIIFTVTGLLAAVAAIFLASKMGSVRPDVAKGYELDIIAMVVLGGISSAGGKGNIAGCILSILVIGFLRYGLGLVNITSQVIMIIVGALLIIAVAIPNLKSSFGQARWIKNLSNNIKNVTTQR
ncbi:ABC transporter permease [Clostridium intestinale]|uniref:ABC transporter permease n=1 Tax=Clostridium intestinale TaxID=36845 RepID=UPI0028ECC4CE|nr:ABC transporter permease [Clostridium intestinale]